MDLDEALTALRSATADVARALGEVDLLSLTREQLLSVVEETHRSGNVLAGVQTVAVAHVAAVEDVVDQHGQWGQQHRGLGHRALDAPELVGPMLGITVQAAATRVEVAVHQVCVTPALVGQMLAGDLDAWRARVVTTEVEACPDEGAAVIVDALVAHYDARGGWDESTGPLRARVRRMVARAHPELVAKQAKEARAGRSVRRSPATMGTDHWEAELPVESSALMWQAVETLARRLRREDPELTLAQARADALAQLVLARADVTVHLHATVPTGDTGTAAATTTPADRDASASAETEPSSAAESPIDQCSEVSAPTSPQKPQLTEVGGLGSTTPTLVDLDALAASATVAPSTPLTCDSDTGAVVGGVVPASLAKRARRDAARRYDGYIVPQDMARLVRLRDGRCRFPGCSINAMYTDQDHVIPWPVGATTPTNLMCLCRRHHRIKQRHGWTVRLDPDGTAHWTDPAGRRWVTHPLDHLDRATGTTATATAAPSDVRAAGPTAADSAAVGSDFPLRLLDLDEIPSLLEDQLRRRLQLATLDGQPPTITVACTAHYPASPPF